MRVFWPASIGGSAVRIRIAPHPHLYLINLFLTSLCHTSSAALLDYTLHLSTTLYQQTVLGQQ